MGLRSQPEFEQMGGTFQEESSHDEEKVKYSPTAQAKTCGTSPGTTCYAETED